MLKVQKVIVNIKLGTPSMLFVTPETDHFELDLEEKENTKIMFHFDR